MSFRKLLGKKRESASAILLHASGSDNLLTPADTAHPILSGTKDSINSEVCAEGVVIPSSADKGVEPTGKTSDRVSGTSPEPANDASGLYAALKSTTQALSVLIRRHEEWIRDKDDFRRILFRTESLLSSLTGPGEDDLVHESERRKDLKSKLDTVLTTLEPMLQPQLSDSPNNPDQSLKITSLIEDVRFTLADYQMSLQHAMYERDRQSMDPDDLSLLNKLTHAGDADHLSGNVRRCLRGTRTEVLRDIERWAEDRNNVRVYWLNGVAGCGKTTIARTFADYAFAEGNLGACFFCSRNVANRCDLKSIFPTLAFELAHRSRDFRARLVQIIESSPNMSHESLPDQLEKLIIQPLKSTGLRAIIIIDALDECKDDEPASVILSLLARRIEDIPSVKFFITGRPEPRIRSGFRLPLLRPHTDVFVLHEVNPTSVNDDIEIFLRSRLSDFAASRDGLGETLPWPSEHDVVTLVRKSGGLFIYAETILKLIAADDSPVDRLRMVVGMPDSTSDEGMSGLDGLYNQIIRDSYSNGVPESFLERLRLVLATIVLAFNPLSCTSLATLLDINQQTILASLRSLHSVILVPGSNSDPICTFHKSFPDYLTDPSRCTDARLYINFNVYHAKVTILCLELMRSQLKKNICDLPQFVMNEDVSDLHTRREKHIGDALEYACRFWAKHLILSSGANEDDITHILELLNDLVQRHLLAWLEVLSITKEMRSAVHSLLDVERWLVDVTAFDMNVLNSIRECRRFILYSFDCIEVSAPHIHDSVLIWLPTSSLVRALYHDQQGTDTKVPRVTRTSWNTCIRSIKLGRGKAVRSVAFSCKGDLIAGGGGNGALQIFESATGACMATLDGHVHFVTSIAFSPDDILLVSGSRDETVRIWDIQTSALVATLEGHTNWVRSVAFSPSGTMVASGANDCTIRIWNVSSGRCEHILKDYLEPVLFVCWLGTNEILAGSRDKPVTIWDVSTEICSKTFRHTNRIYSVASSQDASKFASCTDSRIKIYDIQTKAILHDVSTDGVVTSICFSPDGDQIVYVMSTRDPSVVVWDLVKKVAVLKFGDSGVESVAFAPDGRCVVSGSGGGLKIWQIETRDHDGDVPDYHSKKVTCISLDMNGQMIASGSDDNTVKLWDATTGSCMHTFRGHSGMVRSVAFSPDSSIVASGSSDGTIRMWRVENHGLIRTTKSHSAPVYRVSFSPDGKRLVSISSSEMMIWNVEGGEKLVILRFEPRRWGLRVSFSADGTRLILESPHTTECWDIVRNREPLRIKEEQYLRKNPLRWLLEKTQTYAHLQPAEGNLTSHHLPPQLCIDRGVGDWITDQQNRRVCWIPLDYRGSCSSLLGKRSVVNDIHETTVVLGTENGAVVVLSSVGVVRSPV